MERVKSRDGSMWLALGCWVDSSRGGYMGERIIAIAIEYGAPLEQQSRASGEEYDLVTDEATEWLNENVAPEGCTFDYHPDWGDWGLYRHDDLADEMQ
jgi:hypothetical protein